MKLRWTGIAGQVITLIAAFFAFVLIAAMLFPKAAGETLGAVADSPYPLLRTLVRFQDRNGCSIQRSYEGSKRTLRQDERQSQLGKASSLLRKDGPYELWRTEKGDFWTTPGDVGSLLLTLAEYEFADPIDTRPADVVIDCGAHVGVYTRMALAAGAKLVVAVEPAPVTVECLRRNFKNEIAEGRVIVVQKGVWDSEGTMNMAINPGYTVASSLVITDGLGEAALVPVPLTTIDNMVRELGLSSVNLIKMDVEGAEQNALRGAERVIKQHKPRLSISVYHLPEDPSTVPQIVSDSGVRYRLSFGQCRERGIRFTPELAHFDPI